MKKSYIDFQQLLYWSCRWSLLHVAITWIGTMMIILRKRTFFARYEKKSERTGFDVYAAAKKETVRWCSSSTSATVPLRTKCEGTNVEGNITNNFNNGAWNPNSLPGSVGQYWEALYEGIRKANLIIEKCTEV